MLVSEKEAPESKLAICHLTLLNGEAGFSSCVKLMMKLLLPYKSSSGY